MIRLLTVGIAGPLEPYARACLAALLALGYSPLSAQNQLRLFSHLSRWLGHRRLRAGQLTDERVAAFLRSRRRAGYTCWLALRGLEPILTHLRGLGVVPPPRTSRARTPLERLLARYADYLARERGLAPSTIRQRIDVASAFLADRSATRSALRTLTPSDVRAFLRGRSRAYAPASLAGVGSHLRALLRFFFVEGFIGRSLAEAVPAAVGWRDRALPQGISSRELRHLLQCCDRRTPFGKRDAAVILLLAHLGLRAGEVLALTLDDIDWRSGEIVVHGKGKKRARLPLPDDVGRALSAYVHRRPRIAARRVFLRERAPHRPLHAIGAIVCAASKRAGLAPVWPHRLRRTAATEMLRQGASLDEIAEVLRHTSTQTTAIYATVDRRSLRTLVQPWPGARV